MKALVPFSMVTPDDLAPRLSCVSSSIAHRPNDPLARPEPPVGVPRRSSSTPSASATSWVGCTGAGDTATTSRWSTTSTVDTVRAYVDDMRRFGLAPPTIANRIDGVRAAVSVLAPDQDTAWLMAGINRLRAEHSDRRRKRERIQHTADVVAVGMDLMRNARRSDLPSSSSRDPLPRRPDPGLRRPGRAAHRRAEHHGPGPASDWIRQELEDLLVCRRDEGGPAL